MKATLVARFENWSTANPTRRVIAATFTFIFAVGVMTTLFVGFLTGQGH